jgi:hypothetical protein
MKKGLYLCNKIEECNKKLCICIHGLSPHKHLPSCDEAGGSHCIHGAKCVKVD